MKRFGIVMLLILALTSLAYAEQYGVYVKAVEQAQGTFEEVVSTTEGALSAAGWEILASYDSGVQERCGMRAHNMVIHSPEYAEKVMSHGPLAAFALPLRVGVYEDEKGIHIAFVNPASINRTVLGDGVDESLALETMNGLSESITAAVMGKAVKRQIGEVRSEGKVGGMGGGDFLDKIEEIYSGADFAGTVGKVKEGIEANKTGWRLVYSLELGDAVIYGVTRGKTEAKAFDIAGEKREEDDYQCPGLDHAAAFPIEVIVYKDGDAVKVVTLDEMYRMKLYFEDAGNWAFMKNVTMPGRLEDEIVEMSGARLK